MLKVKVEFEIEEDVLKDIFDGQEIKFTKAKLKELKENLKENEYDVQESLQGEFENYITDLIASLFED